MIPARAASTLDPLIGRTDEQAAVMDALARSRLVSITGLGGTGKTRLARAVSESMAGDTPTWFVDLAAIAHAADVPGAIARAVGVAESVTEDAPTAVAHALAHGPSLVVLDNFEHVLDAGSFVTALLEAASPVRLIVTSRVRLDVPGELVLPLAPLPVPTSVADVESAAASQLFLRRARARGAGLDLDPADAAAVVDICRRLDGLPLALELAAAWTPLLAPRAIVRRLETGRLELASGGIERQASLERVVNSTLELVAPGDRDAFEVLGVFAGAFDEDAAEAITEAAPILPVLRRLEGVALINATPGSDGEPRFALLETIRAVARTRFRDRGDRDAVRRRFASYFADRAQRAADGLRDLGPAPSLAWMTREVANLRRGFDIAVELDDAALAVQLAMAMATYGVRSGSVRESFARLQQALAMGPVPPAIRSEALCAIVNLRAMLGDTTGIADLAREAVELARLAGDQRREVRALIALGSFGPPDEAVGMLEAGAELAERSGYAWGVAVASDNLATKYADQGRFRDALERFRRTAQAAQLAGDQDGVAHALTNVADLLMQLGLTDQALDPATRAVAIIRTTWPESPPLATALGILAMAQALTGGLAEAYRTLAEACGVADATDADIARGDVLESAVPVLAAEHPTLAVRILGYLDVDSGGAPARSARPVVAATAARIRTALGARQLDRQRRIGRDADPTALFTEAWQVAAAAATLKARLAAQFGRFTAREMEVLEILARGASDQGIADKLAISPKTASVHVANIKSKLGVDSRLEAALRARDLVGSEARARDSAGESVVGERADQVARDLTARA